MKVERSGHMWSVAPVFATAKTMLLMVEALMGKLILLERRKLRAFGSFNTRSEGLLQTKVGQDAV